MSAKPASPSSQPKPTFIDLFSGCGGFTLGMLRAGFDCLAAIDFNEQAVATLKANLADKSHPDFTKVRHALQRDLTQFPPAELAALIGTNKLDVIVGGPPCQGFSTARQRDGSNHGTERLKEDPRRHLFRNFLEYVEHFQPKVFVIENVLGLRSAAGGRYFTAVQHEARTLGHNKGLPGYRVHAQVEEGVKLGVPQKRRRQLIVGVRADLAGYFPSDLKPATRASVGAMLGDAIMDLPPLKAGDGENRREYDSERRKEFYSRHLDHGRRFLFIVAEPTRDGALHNHVSRPHSERDLRDFAKIAEGRSSAELMREGVEFEFPYDKNTFKDRYTRQHRKRACSTIVAHLSKDGLMFIHPTQNRSLTPREAARVQSFPDWFVFPEPRTHSFRVIGNAVPPLVGEAVGNAIREFLPTAEKADLKKAPASKLDLPRHDTDAAQRLNRLMTCTQKELRALPTEDFVSGWHALLWLFPGLHPDNACDHGNDQYPWPESRRLFPNLSPEKRAIFTRTGWPVALELIGVEAWRRYDAEEISDEIFYCSAAQQAGLAAYHSSSSHKTSFI